MKFETTVEELHFYREQCERLIQQDLQTRALAKELWRRLDKNLPPGSNQRYVLVGETFASLYEWLED